MGILHTPINVQLHGSTKKHTYLSICIFILLMSDTFKTLSKIEEKFDVPALGTFMVVMSFPSLFCVLAIFMKFAQFLCLTK